MTEDERRAIEADCTRLINHYANVNDLQDWDEVARLYTEDARFGRPSKPGDPVIGRDAILASFKARPPRAQRHVIANVVVEAEAPDRASAFCVILLFQGEAAEEGELPAMSANAPLVGFYRDRMVKTAEGWKFSERIGGLDFRP